MSGGEVKRIEIDYAPRKLFLPYHNRRQRFAAMVAHRRCGKTVACVNDIIPRAASADDDPRVVGLSAHSSPGASYALLLRDGKLCAPLGRESPAAKSFAKGYSWSLDVCLSWY